MFEIVLEIFKRYVHSSGFHKQLVFAAIMVILLLITKVVDNLNVYYVEKKHIDYGVEKSRQCILHQMLHIPSMRIETIINSLRLLLLLSFLPSLLYSTSWLHPLMETVGIVAYVVVVAAVLIYLWLKMKIWHKELCECRSLIAKGYVYQYMRKGFTTKEAYDKYRLMEYYEENYRGDDMEYPRGGQKRWYSLLR